MNYFEHEYAKEMDLFDISTLISDQNLSVVKDDITGEPFYAQMFCYFRAGMLWEMVDYAKTKSDDARYISNIISLQLENPNCLDLEDFLSGSQIDVLWKMLYSPNEKDDFKQTILLLMLKDVSTDLNDKICSNDLNVYLWS